MICLPRVLRGVSPLVEGGVHRLSLIVNAPEVESKREFALHHQFMFPHRKSFQKEITPVVLKPIELTLGSFYGIIYIVIKKDYVSQTLQSEGIFGEVALFKIRTSFSRGSTVCALKLYFRVRTVFTFGETYSVIAVRKRRER